MSECYLNKKKLNYKKVEMVLKGLLDVEKLTVSLNKLVIKKNNFGRFSAFKLKKKYFFRKFLYYTFFLLLEKETSLTNLKNSFFYVNYNLEYIWLELKLSIVSLV